MSERPQVQRSLVEAPLHVGKSPLEEPELHVLPVCRLLEGSRQTCPGLVQAPALCVARAFRREFKGLVQRRQPDASGPQHGVRRLQAQSEVIEPARPCAEHSLRCILQTLRQRFELYAAPPGQGADACEPRTCGLEARFAPLQAACGKTFEQHPVAHKIPLLP